MSTEPEARSSFPHQPPKAFASLESTSFRWLLGSLLTFFLGMQGQIFIRTILAWELTHSEMALAYVNLAIALPLVFGTFIAGTIIDRVERRKIIFIAQGISIVNELVVLVLLMTGHLTYTHLLITAFIIGVMFPFLTPTRTAMIFPLVGRRLLSNAMALQSTVQNIGRVLGPALIGFLVPFLNTQGAYMVGISLFMVSLIMMWKVPRSLPDNNAKKSFLQDVGYSFSYINKHRDILLVLIFGLFPMLIALPIFSFLVVFTDDVWLVGEVGLGFLSACLGAGGIIGSLLVAKLGDSVDRSKLMIISGIAFALVLSAFCLSKSFTLALFLLLCANIFSSLSQTLNQTIVQILAHEEVRGRMSSLVMLSLGLTPLGVLPIAFFSERFGIVATMFTACIILFAVSTAFFIFSPTLRNLDKRLKQIQQQDSEEPLKSV